MLLHSKTPEGQTEHQSHSFLLGLHLTSASKVSKWSCSFIPKDWFFSCRPASLCITNMIIFLKAVLKSSLSKKPALLSWLTLFSTSKRSQVYELLLSTSQGVSCWRDWASSLWGVLQTRYGSACVGMADLGNLSWGNGGSGVSPRMQGLWCQLKPHWNWCTK